LFYFNIYVDAVSQITFKCVLFFGVKEGPTPLRNIIYCK